VHGVLSRADVHTLTVHVGLIGAGNISATHARALSSIPEVRIAAIHAPTREHAMRLAREYRAEGYEALDAFLDHRPMDMVAIGSPSGLHGEHGIAAARRGLHLLIEKPIEITMARTDALIAEAARAAVTLGVIFQDRLKPGVLRMKRLVDAGRLGTAILATAHVKWYRPPSYYADSNWRGRIALDGGGALMNQAVHTVDLLLWLFGRVRRVFGRTATRLHGIEAEDTAVAVLEFASGALGTLEAATSAYPGYSRRLELTGSEGTLVLEGDDLVAVDLREPSGGQGDGSSQATQTTETAADLKPATASDSRAPAAATHVSASSPIVTDASAHQRMFEDFIRAVATRSAPACDGAQGRRSVELVEAIYESARTNRPVDLT
jgi:UDP-N-acetyl-2-amino-2-deoxyglucuronate dehydrogenase